ncbi:MAG: helix-turn-helix domain-containing protein [Sporichthyaceae bacterium]
MTTITIDTSTVAARDRLDFWCSTVCDQFVQLDVRPEAGPAMHGRVEAVSVGETKVRQISAGAHTFVRTPHQVRSADEDYFHIALCHSGTTHVTQHGRETTLRPGEFVLYDSAAPFAFAMEEDFDYSVCLFPKRLLPLSARELADATAIRFDGTRGLGAMIPSLFTALRSHEFDALPSASQDAMMAAIADLYVAMVRSRVDSSAAPSLHLTRARAYVDEHVADLALDPAAIALACSISVSYLHKLFSASGESVTDYIRERRLQSCWTDLARPDLAGLTVGAIGRRWGLPDPAHLSRAFKARFGVSPTEHRARSLSSTRLPITTTK